jgi:KipI family sensor histidine kinase inhibitor
MKPPVLVDLRDGAMLVEFPDLSDEEANRAAVALGARLRRSQVEDAIPAARSLLVAYDPDRFGREAVAADVERLASETLPPQPEEAGRLLRLPVLYDGADLAELAGGAGLPAAELARRHAAVRYRVAFVGFAPGFAYLSGLPAELAAPRLTTPRPRVPSGSVAIGGAWTGVYPSASPGGWRLLGRTSAVLFDAAADPPSLLVPGDRVEFEAVTELVPPRPPAAASAPAGRPTFRVISPGLFTSIQGAPRSGLGSSGVPPGGAMDPRGLALANASVGNPPGAPALEITLQGPELEVLETAVLSWRGEVRSGERVRFGRVERGAREYVAAAGGFVDTRGAGKPTRRLSVGDILCTSTPDPAPSRRPAPGPAPELSNEIPLRVVLGPEAGRFAPVQRERFFAATWRVSPESDRKGLRLEGAPLEHLGAPEIAPSGTVPGTVQIPGSGLPIVLGPDGPVTGGYPRLATVVGADLWRLGQARPGATLRFTAVTFREAASARRAPRSTITLP